MGKMKDQRKQMKKQLKEFEKQIETFGAQADGVEAATLQHTQERLVNLVDAMSAQLKLWQNNMAEVSPNLNGHKTTASILNLGVVTNGDKSSATLTVWNSMEQQIQQWLSTAATIRMEVSADAVWQLAALRTLDTTASEQLRALKHAQTGEQAALQATAAAALADLKHALERVSPA